MVDVVKIKIVAVTINVFSNNLLNIIYKKIKLLKFRLLSNIL